MRAGGHQAPQPASASLERAQRMETMELFEVAAETESPKAVSIAKPDPKAREAETKALHQRVLEELAAVKGHIALSEGLSGGDAKAQLRKAHELQRTAVLEDAQSFIESVEDWAIDQFANGNEIDPSAIQPYLVAVQTQREADLFRYATLQWSVPVSQGYGRRTRFLLKDRNTGKLMAVFALGDPVIAQASRDVTIGWSKDQRVRRLYNVLDAFVLGAVEPYRQLLGGKMAALATLSNETRAHIVRKYVGSISEIKAEQKDPTPVLITTSSALGRSSVYNRVTFNGSTMFHSVGYTKGYGHFQFSEDLFADLRDFVRRTAQEDESQSGRDQSSRYGSGPNWRFRVLRNALQLLGIPEDALKHNIRREVFLAPTAYNWDEFLRGETDEPVLMDLPLEDLGAYYRDRWAIGRAQRRPCYRLWDREDARLSRQLEGHRQLAFGGPRNESGAVSMGPFVIRTGAEQITHRGETVSGQVCDGRVYISRLVGPGLAVDVADILWSNGEREVRGWSLQDGPAVLTQVIGRLRIGVYNHPDFDVSSVMDLRLPAANADTGRVTARQTSIDGLSAIVGLTFVEGLDAMGEVTFGTRASVLRDVSRRKNELCAVFPSDRMAVPAVLWTVCRLFPLIPDLIPSDGLPIPVEGRRAPGRDST